MSAYELVVSLGGVATGVILVSFATVESMWFFVAGAVVIVFSFLLLGFALGKIERGRKL